MSGISGFQPGASVYAQAWGIKNGVGEAPHIDVRDPATSDVLFDLGKNWINEAGNKVWVLTSFSSFNGTVTANWEETTGGSGTGIIQTIDGDSGSITGATVTIFADQGTLNSGSSVKFVNSGTVSTFNVTDALGNTLIGQSSGNLTLSGTSNTSLGNFSSISLTTGSTNIGVGSFSLSSVTTGNDNVGIGTASLDATTIGSFNLGIGNLAGDNAAGTEGSCIYLNSRGVNGQSNVLAIGRATGTGTQQLNSAYIHGIYSNTQNPSGTVEYVTINNTTGLLGVTTAGGSGLIPYTDEAISFVAVVNNGYFCTAALTVTLPAAPTQGEVVTIAIETAGAVVIQAVGAQIIRLGSGASSAAGTATSTAIGSSIELVYRAASTTWFSISTEGSWTLA